jgi:hypothetical protein
MRCSEAKRLIAARHGSYLSLTDADTSTSALHEHLVQCAACRSYEQRLNVLHSAQGSPTQRAYSSISTDRIMRAVQQQKQITRQLEDIKAQQQCRMAQIRLVGIPLIAILFFTLGSIPLLMLALVIEQPDWLASVLSSLSMGVYALFVLLQFVQEALSLVTGNSRLLAIVALALVVMMGMWLRLMRPPRKA